MKTLILPLAAFPLLGKLLVGFHWAFATSTKIESHMSVGKRVPATAISTK